MFKGRDQTFLVGPQDLSPVREACGDEAALVHSLSLSLQLYLQTPTKAFSLTAPGIYQHSTTQHPLSLGTFLYVSYRTCIQIKITSGMISPIRLLPINAIN